MNSGRWNRLFSFIVNINRTYASCAFTKCALVCSRTLKSKTPIYLLSSAFAGLVFVKAHPKFDKSGLSQDLAISNSNVIKEADGLYDEGQYNEVFSVLDKHRASDDPEILWRLGRVIFEKCNDIKEDKEKVPNYEEALQLVEKALEIDDNCWAAHKWRGILLDYVWRYRGVKARINQSFIIKTHLERAIQLNPEDATSYYILGEWCFQFADMPWYQRKVAATLFASPPTSTYEEALNFFEKAEEVTPKFYSLNLLMLGKTHMRLKNKEKAKLYLSQARDYTVKTADDKRAHEEAVKLLKNL